MKKLLKAREEEVKNSIADTYFYDYTTSKIIGNIDFCISTTVKEECYSYYWAEAKRGNKFDIFDSLTQLIITIGKEKTYSKYSTPIFIGAFDAEKILFVEYQYIEPILENNQINWNIPPHLNTIHMSSKMYLEWSMII